MNTLEDKGMELAGKGGTYSPVTVTNHDTVGAAFLGVIAILLLVALFGTQRRMRAMKKRMAQLGAPTANT